MLPERDLTGLIGLQQNIELADSPAGGIAAGQAVTEAP
jgi:hypothetical protein